LPRIETDAIGNATDTAHQRTRLPLDDIDADIAAKRPARLAPEWRHRAPNGAVPFICPVPAMNMLMWFVVSPEFPFASVSLRGKAVTGSSRNT